MRITVPLSGNIEATVATAQLLRDLFRVDGHDCQSTEPAERIRDFALLSNFGAKAFALMHRLIDGAAWRVMGRGFGVD